MAFDKCFSFKHCQSYFNGEARMNTNGFIIIDWDGTQWINLGFVYPTIKDAQNHAATSSRVIHASFADCLDIWPSPEEMQEIQSDIASMETDNTFEDIDD